MDDKMDAPEDQPANEVADDDKAISEDIMDQLHCQLENEQAKSEIIKKDSEQIDPENEEENNCSKSNPIPEVSIAQNPESFTPIEESNEKDEENIQISYQN
jgi:hypothetical protein